MQALGLLPHANQVSASPWSAIEVDAQVHRDAGWVACTRETEMVWVGSEAQPMPMGPGRSRSTMIFVRQGDEGKAVHAHFSPASEAP